MFLMLLLTLFLLYFTKHIFDNRKYYCLPNPGWCVPLLGHHIYFMKARKKNDPINALWQLYKNHSNGKGFIWLKRFNIDIVYVGNFKLLKALFNHSDVQDRIFSAKNFHIIKETKGLLANSPEEHPALVGSIGRVWSDTRRFTIRTLKDFGFGKGSMEELIMEEVSAFINSLKELGSEEFDIIDKFNLPIINALWHITAGERFQYNDQKLKDILNKLSYIFQQLSNPKHGLVIAHPWLSKFDWMKRMLARDTFINCHLDIMDFIRKYVIEHKKIIDTNAPRDFIDMMLIENFNCQDPQSGFYKEKGEENIVVTLFDLFVAGSETTSSTLSWAILYMVRNPEIQQKVQNELDRVVGTNRSPVMDDKANLPYTEAVIMEIQRMGNIAHEGLMHRCRKEVTVNGVTFPENTLVAGLYVEILKGEQWTDGTTFNPERFLDDDGKIVRREDFIPFSIGKRHCLGETLAKTELFLFFSGLMQQLTFLPGIPGRIPSEKYRPGLTIVPEPFTVRVESRI